MILLHVSIFVMFGIVVIYDSFRYPCAYALCSLHALGSWPGAMNHILHEMIGLN